MGIEHKPPASNTKPYLYATTEAGFLYPLVLIGALSLKARRCHVFHIQKRFTQNRSVERHFVTGNIRHIFSQGNGL
jgi:hypothetical protein